MEKVISLKCKNCGNALIYQSDNEYRCHSCGFSFLTDTGEKSCIIQAGILQKYIGESSIVHVPEHVIAIGAEAFKDLYTIEAVVLSENIIKIDDSAFEGCKNLKSINIPYSTKHIGKNAFKGCGITTLRINHSLEHLGENAFMQCEELYSVSIATPLPRACSQTFKYCKNLVDVEIERRDLAQSLYSSSETLKKSDNRPTYFDLFASTPFFTELYSRYFKEKKCLCCRDGAIKGRKCDRCGTVYYKRANGCYIATCVYGSYDCPQVWTLRRFRDNTLGTTWYGRAFIRTYYAISPTLVKWFGKTAWFKKLWKGKLDRMIAKLQAKGIESTPYDDKNW